MLAGAPATGIVGDVIDSPGIAEAVARSTPCRQFRGSLRVGH
jgi:hypothetical protein